MKKSISFCLNITVTSFMGLAAILFTGTQKVSAHSNTQKDQVVFAIGSNGTILKTTLSESDWYRQTRVTGNGLLGADFIDENVGWSVGTKGTILHTTDGGVNWSKQISGTIADLRSVDFVDEKKGWTVGGLIDGTILTTRNGGATWELQATLPERLNAVHFTDADTGWVVGASGSIYHTSNAGMDWAGQDSGTGSTLIDAAFISDHKGWIIAGNKVFVTNDKGVSWKLQASFKESLYALDFIDENSGWAVGINGTIMHTSDGGLHWSRQYSGISISFMDVAFINADVGWVVGAFGIMFYTDDGGLHWSKQNSKTTITLNEIVVVKKSKLEAPHPDTGKKQVLTVAEHEKTPGPVDEENIAGKTDHASLITVDANAPKIVPKKDLTSYVNIRQTPSPDGAIIGKLRPGEELNYVSSFNYWYEVRLYNGQTGYISKTWTRIVSYFPERSARKASVSNVKQSPHQKVSNDSKEYYIQIGAWKNQNYAQNMLEKIKNYYPEAYIVVHDNFNKIRIVGVLTRKQGITVSEDIEEKFNMKPLLVLKTQ